jgi:hypothetical protein
MSREPVPLRTAIDESLLLILRQQDAQQRAEIDALRHRLAALLHADELLRWSLAQPGVGWPWSDEPARVQALLVRPNGLDHASIGVECPYCGSLHQHGVPASDASLGHRLAHCGDRGRKGYLIERTDLTNSPAAVARATALGRRRGSA